MRRRVWGKCEKDSNKRNGTPRAILKTGMAEKGKENQGTYYLKSERDTKKQ